MTATITTGTTHPSRRQGSGAAASRDLRGRRREVPRPRGGVPDPRRLVEVVARAYLEVEAGRRPLRQLVPLLAPAVHLRLEGTHKRPRSHLGPDATSLISIRCSEPGEGVLEAAAIVRRATRVAALVIRAERYRGAWRIVEIARPEDPASPRPRYPGTSGVADVPPSCADSAPDVGATPVNQAGEATLAEGASA